MVSTRAKRSSAQARQTVESCPPENSTSAVSVDSGFINAPRNQVGNVLVCRGLVPEFVARTVQTSSPSIPLRRAGEGIVDDAAIALGERCDLGHLVGAELEIEDRGILRQPLELAGARDDDHLLLYQETQAHLRCAFAVLLADAREKLAVLGVAARDRTIGDDRHPVRRAGGTDLRLVDEGMQLDLVTHQRLA